MPPASAKRESRTSRQLSTSSCVLTKFFGNLPPHIISFLVPFFFQRLSQHTSVTRWRSCGGTPERVKQRILWHYTRGSKTSIMQCKCEVSGCSRVTWNGKKGEQCCRTCKLTGGARHDDGCTPSLCTRPVYRSLTSLVARHDYTPMERSAGMTKLQARVWRLVDRYEPIISRFSRRAKGKTE